MRRATPCWGVLRRVPSTESCSHIPAGQSGGALSNTPLSWLHIRPPVCGTVVLKNKIKWKTIRLVLKETCITFHLEGERNPTFHYCLWPHLLWMCPLLPTQDENMVNFIKGGLKVRNSYLIYKSVFLAWMLKWLEWGRRWDGKLSVYLSLLKKQSGSFLLVFATELLCINRAGFHSFSYLSCGDSTLSRHALCQYSCWVIVWMMTLFLIQRAPHFCPITWASHRAQPLPAWGRVVLRYRSL